MNEFEQKIQEAVGRLTGSGVVQFVGQQTKQGYKVEILEGHGPARLEVGFDIDGTARLLLLKSLIEKLYEHVSILPRLFGLVRYDEYPLGVGADSLPQ